MGGKLQFDDLLGLGRSGSVFPFHHRLFRGLGENRVPTPGFDCLHRAVGSDRGENLHSTSDVQPSSDLRINRGGAADHGARVLGSG